MGRTLPSSSWDIARYSIFQGHSCLVRIPPAPHGTGIARAKCTDRGLYLHPGKPTFVFDYEVVTRHLAKRLGYFQSVFRRHGHEAHLGPFPAPFGVLDL